jgi:hypothetical protein
MRIPDHIDPTDHEAVADWLESDDVDIDDAVMLDGTPLRRVVAADEAVQRARQFLIDEVRAAHEAGHSWAAIGVVLGISRQAARERFGVPTNA